MVGTETRFSLKTSQSAKPFPNSAPEPIAGKLIVRLISFFLSPPLGSGGEPSFEGELKVDFPWSQ